MKELSRSPKEKTLIRACHSCLKLNESHRELERCTHCNKAFLPLRYFEKIHADKNQNFSEHFSDAGEVDEVSLIKGLFVLW